MIMRKIVLISLALMMSFTVMAQRKKVAVVTFYVNKYIGTASGLNSIGTTIGALSKNEKFNLKPTLEKFHKTFFSEFAKQLPFDLIDEKVVTSNAAYQAYNTIDTSSVWRNALLMDGYKYVDVSGIFKRDLDKLAEFYGKDVDGFMFVFLSYEIAAKVSFGGMGTAGILGYINMKLWTREGNKVFNISEAEMSKGTVPLVAGVPVMDVDKILPLCNDATDDISEEMLKKLPKILKKVEKNFK